MIRIIDTFQDYHTVIKNEKPKTVEDRLAVWETYIQHYPELEKKLKEDYTSAGIDWYEFALTHVFNHQNSDYNKMMLAYENLHIATENVMNKLLKIYGNKLDLNIVYYSGLCNSAGWVDHYQGKKAILLGIDKIAELGWHDIKKLETLLAHELCHVLHYDYRQIDIIDDAFKGSLYDEGIWRIYEEGMATFFQDTLTDHTEDTRGLDWITRCTQIMPDLKKHYLRALNDEIIGTRDFYGDWYQVEGISDVGYFLGREIIKTLHQKMDFKSIACLNKEDITYEVMKFLKL